MRSIKLFFIILGISLSNTIYSQHGGNARIGAQIETGYGIKLDKNSVNAYQIFLSPYYRVNNNLLLGVGAGFQRHTDMLLNHSMPIFIHSTYKFNADSAIKPFLKLKIGYGLGSNDMGAFGKDASGNNISGKVTQQPGLFLSPAVGVNYNLKNNHAIFFSLSYDLLKMKYTGGEVLSFFPLNNWSNSTLGLRLGYEF